MRRIFQIRAALLLLGLATGLLATGCSPRQLIFEDKNFACELPAGWITKKQDRFAVDAYSIWRHEAFIVLAKPLQKVFPISSPIFSDAMRKKLIADGHEIVSESREPFAGQPAYTVIFRRVLHGTMTYTYSVNFVAGGILYGVNIAKQGGVPTDDPDLMNVLHSFHLLKEPPTSGG